MTAEDEFGRCYRACRIKQWHTLVWGGCAHAINPEPTVSMSKVYKDPEDGYPSIGYDSYTVEQLARLIEPALRASDVEVSADRFDELARVAAHAIVHRNEEQPL